MPTSRAFLLVLAVFALSLGGLGAAATTAWLRCGGEDGCRAELALGIVALAPAALLLSTCALLLRAKGASPRRDRLLVSVAAGIAAVPLLAFVLREVAVVAAASALFAALVMLLLSYQERDEASEPAVAASPEAAGGGVERAAARPQASADELWDVQVTSVHAVAARRRGVAAPALDADVPEPDVRLAAPAVAAPATGLLPPPSLLPLEAALASLDARMRALQAQRVRRR